MNQSLIYGDIGGTKTLLRAAVVQGERLELQHEHRYESREYTNFDDMLRDFLAQSGCHPDAICLAVAGPVVAQQVELTNLSWVMNANELAKKFSIPAVRIINDFEAAALSIEILAEDDLVTLQTGNPSPTAMRVILGAGTGMGVAWLVKQGARFEPLATEAGHIDFAPVNEIQIELFRYLAKKYQHVSVERLLSGQGLAHIFNFLQAGATVEFPLKSIELNTDDGATVTHLAFEHQHPTALQALEIFVEIYGAYAGNLALAGLCRGGVYIAGGIAPYIIDVLKQPRFMEAFRDKGRFSGLLHEIPVHVIMNRKAGLLGAGLQAQRILQQ